MADRRDLEEEIRGLRGRLEEAEETLRAIRGGEVDALVVQGPDGDQIYTLKGAEEPYRILVERMRDGALTLTADGHIVYSNRAFSELIGLPLEQAFGKAVETFVATEQRPVLRALLADAVRGGGRGELRFVRGDGSVFPALVSLAPLPMDDIGALSAIVTDLTEQRRREEIAAAERFARSILEQATDAVVVCDRGGRVTHVSQAAEPLCEVPPIGLPFVEAFSLQAERPQDDAADSVGACIGAALAGKLVHGLEVRCVGDRWRDEHFLLSAGPLRGSGSEPVGCIVTLTDVTALHKAQLALDAALAEKDSLLRQKEMLLQEVNHRVKNGLQLVASLLTLQSRRSEDQRVRRQLEEARSRVLAVAQLHERLHRADAEGRVPFAPYLRTLCADLSRSLLRDRKRRAVTVVADEVELPTDEAIPLALIANELVTNAIKYALADRPESSVTVTLRADPDGTLRLEVADDGPGLPPDFEAGRPAGLGMTIISGLATQLRARVDRPPADRGTTVRITLSAAKRRIGEGRSARPAVERRPPRGGGNAGRGSMDEGQPSAARTPEDGGSRRTSGVSRR